MKKLSLFGSLVWITCTPIVGAAPTALEDHMAREEQLKAANIFILPHRPNYFMPFSYNTHPNLAPYPPGTESFEDTEIQFQLSAKIPIVDRLFNFNVAPTLAYTQLSYWQAYADPDSSRFRSTDYEPEFFLQFNDAHALGPVTNRYNRIGYAHQSNGESGTLSRSWNRLYAEFVLDHKNTMVSIKPWYRIAGHADGDSNPDIWRYMGYGELRSAMKLRAHELSLLFRNNLQTHDNKGAIELGWAFPLIQRMKGYIQYFNGYGDSLIDYNVPISRISVGFSFSNWL